MLKLEKNMDNKKTLITFSKVAILFILGIFVIAASAGALNYAVTAGSFYAVAGVLNLGVSGFSIYSLYKRLFKK